jgi:hypothetical protein
MNDDARRRRILSVFESAADLVRAGTWDIDLDGETVVVSNDQHEIRLEFVVGPNDGIRAKAGAKWISVCNLNEADAERHIATSIKAKSPDTTIPTERLRSLSSTPALTNE